MNGARHSPPDIGGVDATSRKSREASFEGADGVVSNGTNFKERIPKLFRIPDHPVCAAVVASHRFLDGAATPPISGGELAAPGSYTVSGFIQKLPVTVCNVASATRYRVWASA
jgi:hypothetical protein